jgi:hypothetical protein
VADKVTEETSLHRLKFVAIGFDDISLTLIVNTLLLTLEHAPFVTNARKYDVADKAAVVYELVVDPVPVVTLAQPVVPLDDCCHIIYLLW